MYFSCDVVFLISRMFKYIVLQSNWPESDLKTISITVLMSYAYRIGSKPWSSEKEGGN